MTSRIPLPLPPLYTIADPEALGGRSIVDAIAAMADAGIRWIQLRAKCLQGAALYRLLESILRRLEGGESRLWLDDRVDVAALLPLSGVHLGQRDLPVGAARAILGQEMWVGLSTHNQRQIEAAESLDVDAIAVGPVFATAGKENPDPVVGLELVRWARSRAHRPLIAIGGLTAETIPQVLAAGADTVAVLGAACRGDVYRSCRELVSAAEGI